MDNRVDDNLPNIIDKIGCVRLIGGMITSQDPWFWAIANLNYNKKEILLAQRVVAEQLNCTKDGCSVGSGPDPLDTSS